MKDMEGKLFPVQQRPNHRGNAGTVNESVYMAAYEVYAHVYGEQKAMIEGHCRGGFGAGEIIAFLYAKSFPKNEWAKRIDEALKGMKLGG